MHKQTKEELEPLLVIGCKIKLGKEYAKQTDSVEGEIIELVQGWFESDNGLYTTPHSLTV